MWDSLGSRYECCSPGYIKTVESRLSRDVSFEAFDMRTATSLLRNNWMLLADLIMNQVPWVTQEIKNLWGVCCFSSVFSVSFSCQSSARRSCLEWATSSNARVSLLPHYIPCAVVLACPMRRPFHWSPVFETLPSAGLTTAAFPKMVLAWDVPCLPAMADLYAPVARPNSC